MVQAYKKLAEETKEPKKVPKPQVKQESKAPSKQIPVKEQKKTPAQ
jgi:hypothetical protein